MPKPNPENNRISGTPLHTPLSQLPDRFTFGPHTELMSKYLSRRFKATSYGWWKREKAITYNPEWQPEGRKGELYRVVEYPNAGLRFVGKVHEIHWDDGYRDNRPSVDGRRMIDHTGWYTEDEPYQHETVCGLVYQLPSRDGQWLYVPAVSDANNDAATLDFHSITDDIRDAIRWADHMAKRYAEEEREYQRKDRAENRIAEIDEETKTIRAKLRTLIQELRGNCDKLTGLHAVRSAIRTAIQSARAELRELAQEREEQEAVL